MATRFFHESNFAGLVEKVRERGRATSNQKMTEQFNRLFNVSPIKIYQNDKKTDSSMDTTHITVGSKCSVGTAANDTSNCGNKKDGNVLSDILENERESSSYSSDTAHTRLSKAVTEDTTNNSSSQQPIQQHTQTITNTTTAVRQTVKSSSKGCNGLHKRLSDSDMVANHHNTLESKSKRAVLKDSKSCNDIKSNANNIAASGKGNARLESSVAECCGGAADVASAAAAGGGVVVDVSGGSSCYTTSSMCAVLCSMMKVQLHKTYEEVVARYGGHFDMSNITEHPQQVGTSFSCVGCSR